MWPLNRILPGLARRFGKVTDRADSPPGSTKGAGRRASATADAKPAASRILIIEDDGDILQVLKLLLEYDGHVIATAKDGPTALSAAAAATQPFDLVVTDISMPMMSGIDVARSLRAMPATANIRIVFHTGLDEHWVRDRFADYDLFVNKASDTDLLAGKITDLLARPKPARAKAGQPEVEPSFSVDDFVRTQRSLRGAIGVWSDEYSTEAFLRLLDVEIGQLRKIGQSDTAIAALIGDVLQRDFPVALIEKHAQPVAPGGV